MSNKTNERLVHAVLYLILLAVAATGSYLISDLIMRALNTIMVLEQTHAASVIRLFLTLIISCLILTVVSYWEGYHFASFDKGVVFPAIGMSLSAHLLLGFVFGFSPWVTGGVLYLTGWITYGRGYTSECSMATKDISIFCFFGAFLIFASVYAFFMSFPRYYGMIKRYADRETLLEERQRKTTYVQPADEYDKNDRNEDENS